MTLATFRLELRRDRMLTFWLGVIAFAYAGTMAAFFPLMKDNLSLIDEYMEILPREFLVAFGMTGSLADPGVFFTTYVGSYVWPIVAALAGILLATRPVAADSDRGFLDLPLSTPMSRTRYLSVSIVGQVLVMIVLAVAMMGGVVVVWAVADAGLDSFRLLLVSPSAVAFGWAVAGIVIGMYLLNVVAQLQPDLEWIARLSLFHYFDTTAIIDDGAMPWADIAVHAIVAAVTWALALVLFRRRDLAA